MLNTMSSFTPFQRFSVLVLCVNVLIALFSIRGSPVYFVVSVMLVAIYIWSTRRRNNARNEDDRSNNTWS